MYSTVLDYCGIADRASEGTSLRPLIDGSEDGLKRFAVSEWNGTSVPGYMITDGRHKLMFGRGLNARSVDALYDLHEDPQELHNLLAHEADFSRSRSTAERLKERLVSWLDQTHSPRLTEMKARILKPAQ